MKSRVSIDSEPFLYFRPLRAIQSKKLIEYITTGINSYHPHTASKGMQLIGGLRSKKEQFLARENKAK
jgi:hypothetical protein